MKKGLKISFHDQSYHFLGKIDLEPSSVSIGLRYFVNCHNVCSDAHRYIVLDGSLIHHIKRVFHDSIRASIDTICSPFVTQAVLNPLKIGDSHPTGIRQYIWYGHDSFFIQNGICLGRSGTIGTFHNQLGFDLVSIGNGNNILNSCRNQYIHLQGK